MSGQAIITPGVPGQNVQRRDEMRWTFMRLAVRALPLRPSSGRHTTALRQDRLGWFHLVIADLDRHALLQEMDGDQEAVFAATRHDNTFKPHQ